jgi:hypothetical protein
MFFEHSEHARPESNIIIDALRKWVGSLKDHTDALAQVGHIDIRRINVLAVEEHLSFGARPRHHIVHPVERTQKGRFATARWPNQRGDSLFGNGKRQPEERLKGAIVKV